MAFDYGKKLPEFANQYEKHPTLTPEELATLPKVRAVRTMYVHVGRCRKATQMPLDIATTMAINPYYYKAMFCWSCKNYFPLHEFIWWEDKKSLNYDNAKRQMPGAADEISSPRELLPAGE